LRKVLLLAGLFLLFAVFQGCGEGRKAGQTQTHEITQEELGEKTTCPICGMPLMVSSHTPAVKYKGKIYYFCNEEDKAQFMKDPEKALFEQKEKEQKRKAAREVEEEPEIGEEEIKALGYGFHKISQEEMDQIVLCPGCKKYLAVVSETPALEKDGEVFYFCSKACMKRFLDRKK
jgi:YHS domain-containing protein